ncbi:RNA-processing protein [uncultured archaeon]|nr:RNA-processing protein [uncultured archaeon]
MEFVGVGDIKIPVERVPVLIGREGTTKKKIEKLGNVWLNIDSETGEVKIIQTGDPILASVTVGVVQAIGRGFSPERAQYLYNDGFQLIVIPLREFAKSGSRRITQVRGRVIGREGRTRKIIEELTSTYVSVYGDTVSIIGDYLSINYSKEAIMKLLNGSKHKTVYKYLEHLSREIRFKKIEETFG